MPKTKKTSKRKPNPAFMKPVQPDDKLAAVVGSTPLSRPADDALRPVFNGKSQVSMFEMTKLVSKHLK